jgi:hypothetical protein
MALLFAFAFARPDLTLAMMSYAYLLSAFVEMIVLRLRHRGSEPAPATALPTLPAQDLSDADRL